MNEKKYLNNLTELNIYNTDIKYYEENLMDLTGRVFFLQRNLDDSFKNYYLIHQYREVIELYQDIIHALNNKNIVHMKLKSAKLKALIEELNEFLRRYYYYY